MGLVLQFDCTWKGIGLKKTMSFFLLLPIYNASVCIYLIKYFCEPSVFVLFCYECIYISHTLTLQ